MRAAMWPLTRMKRWLMVTPLLLMKRMARLRKLRHMSKMMVKSRPMVRLSTRTVT